MLQRTWKKGKTLRNHLVVSSGASWRHRWKLRGLVYYFIFSGSQQRNTNEIRTNLRNTWVCYK